MASLHVYHSAFDLVLTSEEAEVLLNLTGNTLGSKNSPRIYCDKIYTALYRAGVARSSDSGCSLATLPSFSDTPTTEEIVSARKLFDGSISLILQENSIKTVCALIATVSGTPNSPRVHTSTIYRALSNSGVKCFNSLGTKYNAEAFERALVKTPVYRDYATRYYAARGKMSTPNVDRICTVVGRLTLFPEKHKQGYWIKIAANHAETGEQVKTSCGTTGCVAGWACVLFSGDNAVYSPKKEAVFIKDSEGAWVYERGDMVYIENARYPFEDKYEMISIAGQARRLLGLSHSQSNFIFSGERTAEEIIAGFRYIINHPNADEKTLSAVCCG